MSRKSTPPHRPESEPESDDTGQPVAPASEMASWLGGTDAAADRPPTELARTIFPHAHLRRIVTDVSAALSRPGGRQMLAVSAPPGVGKTTAIALIDNVLCYGWRDEMAAKPSFRPVTIVEAPPPEDGEFPWSEFWLEVIAALGDPALDRLVGAEEIDGTPPGPMIRPARLGERELLRIAKRRYPKRETKVLLIDEAQHITSAPGSPDLRENLDRLKSFANATGVRIGLFGYYGTPSGPGVLDVGRASAQLGRRIRPVDFPRYRWAIAREQAEFKRVVRAMLAAVDGLTPELIEDSIDACYERSYGCVGTLHQWLVEAEAAFRTTGRAWSACLASTATDVGTGAASIDEILEAEERVRASSVMRVALRQKLGLPPVPGKSGAPAPKTAAKAPARPRRAGRRAPKRDEVGTRG